MDNQQQILGKILTPAQIPSANVQLMPPIMTVQTLQSMVLVWMQHAANLAKANLQLQLHHHQDAEKMNTTTVGNLLKTVSATQIMVTSISIKYAENLAATTEQSFV